MKFIFQFIFAILLPLLAVKLSCTLAGRFTEQWFSVYEQSLLNLGILLVFVAAWLFWYFHVAMDIGEALTNKIIDPKRKLVILRYDSNSLELEAVQTIKTTLRSKNEAIFLEQVASRYNELSEYHGNFKLLGIYDSGLDKFYPIGTTHVKSPTTDKFYTFSVEKY